MKEEKEVWGWLDMDHGRWDPQNSFPGISGTGIFSPSSLFFLPPGIVGGHSVPSSISDDFPPGSSLLPWPQLTPSWLGAAPGSKPPGNSSHLPGARAKSFSEPPGTSARCSCCRRKIGVHELQPPKLGLPQKFGGKYTRNQSWNWGFRVPDLCQDLSCHVLALPPRLPRALGCPELSWHRGLAQVTPGPPSTCCPLWGRGLGEAGTGPAWLGSRCCAGRGRLRASAVSHRAASPAVCPEGPRAPSRTAADGVWGFPRTGRRLRDPRTSRP